MCDLQLMYRECGAETRDDYLRDVANENGLPLDVCGGSPTGLASVKISGL
jgi:hypothetical protein